jgi:sugar lactone lactonase YvrE
MLASMSRRTLATVVVPFCAVLALGVAAASSAPVATPSLAAAHPGGHLVSAVHLSPAQGLSASPFVSSPGAVTVVGTGAAGFSGNGGPATSAELSGPGGIAVDSAGDLFVADTGNCQIREVPATSGTHFSIPMTARHVYAVAGATCAGSDQTSSAGAPAVGFATSVAVDSHGDLFIADPSNNQVLELLSNAGVALAPGMKPGKLSVVAGNGSGGYSGDGQAATSAELDEPEGVGVDPAGDLYIADTANCVVREVASHTGDQWGVAMVRGSIYTVAGTHTCGQVGDGGPALHAELWNPSDVVIGPGGVLLVADSGGEEVLAEPETTGSFYGVHIAAGHLAVVAGFGFYGPYFVDGLPATGETSELNSPTDIAVDSYGDLYITDTYSSCVREVANRTATVNGLKISTGDMYTVAGEIPTGTDFTETKWIGPEVLYPVGVAVSSDGAVYYADQGANVVRELSGA